MESAQKLIDSYMSSMEEQITNKSVAATMEQVIIPNMGRQSSQYEYALSDMSHLYIANGSRVVDAETCKSFDVFQSIC